jgi:hypothetical protein
VSHEEMAREMAREEYKNYEIYGIGVGSEMDEKTLKAVGRDGTEHATDQGKVQGAFERVAGRIEAHMKRFYLLSYCTPARKGRHKVRIEATREGSSGSLEYEFDAEGFGPPPACDPERKPDFDLEATDKPRD